MGRHSADAASAVPGEEPGQSGVVNEYETGTQPAVGPPRPPAPPGYRRRVAVAIGVALVGIVLLVFGFISLTTTADPPANDAQNTTVAVSTPAVTTTQAPVTTTSTPPPAPAVLPVTVLNASPELTPGLATSVAAALEAAGWPIVELRNYDTTEITQTTAYFTPGNAAEEAAAQALVAQFPEITGGAQPRFDELLGSGLTVATVGDWQP